MICCVTLSTVTNPRWSVFAPLFELVSTQVAYRKGRSSTYAKVASTLEPRDWTVGHTSAEQEMVEPTGTALLQYAAPEYSAKSLKLVKSLAETVTVTA